MEYRDKIVLYLGNFLFPLNGAAAKRVLNIGRTLRLSGYNVIFAGNNDYCQEEDKNSDGVYRYDGFEYYNNYIKNNINKRVDYYYSFNRVLSIIEKIESEGRKIRIIIGYHMDFLGMMACIKYCNKNGIKFISDCTEWYDPCQTIHGRFGLSYYNSQLRMLIANKKVDGMITISKYLENYYKKYTKVIRVPALDDVNEMRVEREKYNDKVKFVYCGNPGKKDDLSSIWDALGKIGCEKSWELNIVGISKDDSLFEKDKYSPEVIKRFIFHGRLPIEKAQSIIKDSDFSILIRPENKRYTKAGFPTKFAESLSLGTPVISNLTSDIRDFLINGENGIVVKKSTPEAISEALKYALSLKSDKLLLMRKNAHKCAKENFDYRQYTDKIVRFIKSEVHVK